jgi:hypothetical protein
MESACNPKDSARRTDSDAGQNSPCATDRHKWCEKKEECRTRPSGGKHPNPKETQDTEETTGWFHTRATMHRTNTRSYNRTVCVGEERTETQEIPMEEEIG